MDRTGFVLKERAGNSLVEIFHHRLLSVAHVVNAFLWFAAIVFQIHSVEPADLVKMGDAVSKTLLDRASGIDSTKSAI